MNRIVMQLAVSAVAMAGLSASAATVAYWRFEDTVSSAGSGPTWTPAVDGQTLTANGGNPAGTDRPYTPDYASGNLNPLQIYSTNSGSAFSSSVPGSTVAGQPNAHSMSFNNGGDTYVPGYQNWPVTTTDLGSGWTIEASVSLHTASGWQGLVCKQPDGVNAGRPEPSFVLKFRDAEKVFGIEMRDGNNVYRRIDAPTLPAANVWYDIATTGSYDPGTDTSTVSFYMKQSGQAAWNLEAQQAFPGRAMVVNNGDFLVGRGYWGGVTDFANANIDEVRVSNVALTPDQFLMSVPEPASMAVFGIAGLALLRRKRA